MPQKNATFDLKAYEQQREKEKHLKKMSPEQQAQYAQVYNAQYQAAALMQQQQAALSKLSPDEQQAYAAAQQQAAALAAMTPEQQSAYVSQQQASVDAALAQPSVTPDQKVQLKQHQVALAQQQAAIAQHAALSPEEKQQLAQEQHQRAFDSLSPDQQSQYLAQTQAALAQQLKVANAEQKQTIISQQKAIAEQQMTLSKQGRDQKADADAGTRPVVAPTYGRQRPLIAPAYAHSSATSWPGKSKGKGGPSSQEQFANFRGKKVFVGGLPGSLTREELWNYFGQFGNLKEAIIAVDRNGQSKYFGFVTYFRNDDVRLLGTRDHYVAGRWIDVKPYDDGEDKGKGRCHDDRSRSRQRSRSRGKRRRQSQGRCTPSPLRGRSGSKNSRPRSASRSRSSSKAGRSRSANRSRFDSRSRSRARSAERRTKTRADYRNRQREALEAIADLPVSIEVEGGGEKVAPLTSWEDAVERKIMPRQLMEILVKEGLRAPTLVQRYCIPMAHNRNRDLICSAQTGSGKTFAFVIPTVCALINQGEVFRPWFPGQLTQGSPLVLVLSPTRELAIQTDREVNSLFHHTPHLRSMCVYGGEPLPTQLARMDRQIDFLSGTPGRVMDMIDQARLSLNYVQTLVIDEADQMFDLGLEKVVLDAIFGRDLPAERQTLLFSATFPPQIQDLCKSTLRALNPEMPSDTGHWSIIVGKGAQSGGSGDVSHIVQQVLMTANDAQKELFCMRDISQYCSFEDKCIVFTNRRKQAEALHAKLIMGCPNLKINHLHGKLEQWQREEVVSEFDQGKGQVLIASNVASRGLDFTDVKIVIQFDMAEDLTVYTHRIGRTGRLGSAGHTITYFSRHDRQLAKQLSSFLKMNKQTVPDWLCSL